MRRAFFRPYRDFVDLIAVFPALKRWAIVGFIRMKRYMVIEHFAPGAKDKIYERFREKGRMLPDGLVYIDSWLEANGDRCFQLMETNDPALFEQWMESWKDLVSFEIVELGEKPE